MPEPPYTSEPKGRSRILLLYMRQHGRCSYCGTMLMSDDGQSVVEHNIDHIVPKARGGKDCMDNLCLSCTRCNTLKSDMSADDFRVLLRMIEIGAIKEGSIGAYRTYLRFRDKILSLGITH